MSRLAHFRRAIEIMVGNPDIRALVLEVAKHNPAALVAAQKRIDAREAAKSGDAVEQILRSGVRGGFVAAIKKRRELTGDGLKEAKDYVDALRTRLGIVTQ